MNPKFTHCLIGGHWHVCRVFRLEDFTECEKLGENEIDGEVFIAVDKHGSTHFLKNIDHEN